MNRVGDQIKDQLKRSNNMDFFWKNTFEKDNSLGILTHLTNIHYSTE